MPNLIFGKIFASMFTGSLYGSGAHVFAVMSYVIGNMQPNKERVEYIRLNPRHLADTIGEPIERIQEAIDFLCAPDLVKEEQSEEGKRLVMESPFVYRVVNGEYYRTLKDEDDRLRKDADRSARYREKKASKKKEILLTGKDAEAFEAAKNGTYHKRRKVAQRAGEVAGGTQAVDDSMAEANGHVPHGTSPAESQGDAQGDAGLRMALARKRDEKSTDSPEPSNGVTFTRPT